MEPGFLIFPFIPFWIVFSKSTMKEKFLQFIEWFGTLIGMVIMASWIFIGLYLGEDKFGQLGILTAFIFIFSIFGGIGVMLGSYVLGDRIRNSG